MIRKLNEDEYRELLGKYSVWHFMGGGSAEDKSHTIYLTKGGPWLVSSDDMEAIQRHESLLKLEAKEYFNQLENTFRV